MKRRSEYSLLECLVVFGLISVVLTTITMTLHVMYRAERNLREGMELERSLTVLSERFRGDVHTARSYDLLTEDGEPTSNQIRFDLHGSRIVEYTSRPGRVERVVRSGGRVVQREPIYLTSCEISWSVRVEQSPFVSMVVAQPDKRTTPRQVVAALGLVSAASESSVAEQ